MDKIKSFMVGMVLKLWLLCVFLFAGCGPKKPVQPIHGPALAKYKLSDCKPLPGYQPGLDCNHVRLIPLTLDAGTTK